MNQLFTELKRRNVFKVAMAYLVVGWLLAQVTTTLENALGLPQWLDAVVIVFLLIGFPIALIFAWAFELTPEGIKRSHELEAEYSITRSTNRKIDFVIIGALVMIIWGLIYNGKFSDNDLSAKLVKTIAVLPFVNMSSDKDHEWFSDGLTEEILNSLTMLPELQVTARTSSFFFKGKNIPVPEIAKKLGVTYVVEGSVRRAGDTLRITAQLIRAGDGYHLWSNTYDKPASDILDIQRDVAESVAQALGVILDDKRRKEMLASGTRNVEAFEAYYQGNRVYTAIHAGTSGDSLWDANTYFEQAIAADPDFAAPYFDMADVYSHFILHGANSALLMNKGPEGLNEKEAFAQIRYYQNKAAELAKAPQQKLAYEFIEHMSSGDWRRVQSFLKKMKANPASSEKVIGSWFIEYLYTLKKDDLVLPLLLARLEHDPFGFFNWYYIQGYHLREGHYKMFFELYDQGKKEGNIFAEKYEILAYIKTNNQDKLEEIIKQALNGDLPAYLIVEDELVLALAITGRKQEALEKIKSISKDRNLNAFTLWAYHLLGEEENAFKLAQNIDNRPLGILEFASVLAVSKFNFVHKEAAPNFVRKLRQAGLSKEDVDLMFLPTETERKP